MGRIRARFSARDRFIALAAMIVVLVLCLIPVFMLRHSKSPGTVIAGVAFLITAPLIVLRIITSWMNRARPVAEQRWRDGQTYRRRERASADLDEICRRAEGGPITLTDYARLTRKTAEAAALDIQRWVHGGLLAARYSEGYSLQPGRTSADLRDAIIIMNQALFPFGPRPTRQPSPVLRQSVVVQGHNYGTIRLSQESQQTTALLAELAAAIRASSDVASREQGQILANIDSLRSHLAARAPDKQIAARLWQAVSAAATISGAAGVVPLIQQISQALAQAFR